jgi:protein tyrosine/serine phosphatase
MLSSLFKPKDREAARNARIARWDRPLRDTADRLRAWVNMLAVDHGIFRVAYLNFHKVTPDFWRAAQPTPGQIARLAAEGLRTIVNLRGGREHGSWPLEREACERHGIVLSEFVVRSRGAPDRDSLLAAPAYFASLAYPVLVHCKSGADRAGFMAALYLVVHEKRPVREAMAQLALRYGHFRFAKTGMLDAFFEMYLRDGEAHGIAFLDWVRDHYDPEALERAFRPSFFSDILVDRIMHRE